MIIEADKDGIKIIQQLCDVALKTGGVAKRSSFVIRDLSATNSERILSDTIRILITYEE